MDRQQYEHAKWLSFMRMLQHPYWTPNPLAWQAGHIGLAHFALDGRVGLFNLCWLMLQCKHPPGIEVYDSANLNWVITQSGGAILKGKSLEHHAAVRTLYEFHMLVKPYATGRDFPMGTPWTKLATYSERSLA